MQDATNNSLMGRGTLKCKSAFQNKFTFTMKNQKLGHHPSLDQEWHQLHLGLMMVEVALLGRTQNFLQQHLNRPGTPFLQNIYFLIHHHKLE